MPGINGKMNELQAALGLVMLDYLEAERKKRKQLQDNSIIAVFKTSGGLLYRLNLPT